MTKRRALRGEIWTYTGPDRMAKTVNVLAGILQGIIADGVVDQPEYAALTAWMNEHKELRDRNPFAEIWARLEGAMADGHLSVEEVLDVVWLCQQLQPGGEGLARIKADMQQLHGLLGGVVANRVIADDEVHELRVWLEDHELLRGYWPYDEIDSLLTHVLKDGKIDDQEREMMLHFFGEFSTISGSLAVSVPLNEPFDISGMCAVCPEVLVDGRVFCFTGTSHRAERAEIKRLIEAAGGSFQNHISGDLHYLVIGAKGNACWAFSCYGRKIEEVVHRRRGGETITIVHEHDFWDAMHPKGSEK